MLRAHEPEPQLVRCSGPPRQREGANPVSLGHVLRAAPLYEARHTFPPAADPRHQNWAVGFAVRVQQRERAPAMVGRAAHCDGTTLATGPGGHTNHVAPRPPPDGAGRSPTLEGHLPLVLKCHRRSPSDGLRLYAAIARASAALLAYLDSISLLRQPNNLITSLSPRVSLDIA